MYTEIFSIIPYDVQRVEGQLTRWPVIVCLEPEHHLEPWGVEVGLESGLPWLSLEVLLSPAP